MTVAPASLAALSWVPSCEPSMAPTTMTLAPLVTMALRSGSAARDTPTVGELHVGLEAGRGQAVVEQLLGQHPVLGRLLRQRDADRRRRRGSPRGGSSVGRARRRAGVAFRPQPVRKGASSRDAQHLGEGTHVLLFLSSRSAERGSARFGRRPTGFLWVVGRGIGAARAPLSWTGGWSRRPTGLVAAEGGGVGRSLVVPPASEVRHHHADDRRACPGDLL